MTTSILVNIPGEASSVITCLDGYAMARQGRAGPALGIAAFGSFIGGTLSILGVAYLAPALAEFGLRFGPPEYAALMLFGLTALVYLAHGPMDKAILMALFGMLLASVGLDPFTGQPRFTFLIFCAARRRRVDPGGHRSFRCCRGFGQFTLSKAGEIFQKNKDQRFAANATGLERFEHADRARNALGIFRRPARFPD